MTFWSTGNATVCSTTCSDWTKKRSKLHRTKVVEKVFRRHDDIIRMISISLFELVSRPRDHRDLGGLSWLRQVRIRYSLPNVFTLLSKSIILASSDFSSEAITNHTRMLCLYCLTEITFFQVKSFENDFCQMGTNLYWRQCDPYKVLWFWCLIKLCFNITLFFTSNSCMYVSISYTNQGQISQIRLLYISTHE